MLDKEYYKDYCNRYNAVWNWIKSNSIDKDKVVEEICEKRNYSVERMGKLLSEIGFSRLDTEVDIKIFAKKEFSDLGLYKDGKFLLESRYIFPVKDMLGNVVALIGWYKDEKKYITTPSALFSKSGMFFGMEQLNKTGVNKRYFLVEGIFDSLSLRSLGYNAIAQMGIDTSLQKQVLYGLFRRVVAIPDSDGEGRKVISMDAWKIPVGSSYMKWSGTVPGRKNGLKDIDDLCNYYEKDVVIPLLNDTLCDDSRVIEYKLS